MLGTLTVFQKILNCTPKSVLYSDVIRIANAFKFADVSVVGIDILNALVLITVAWRPEMESVMPCRRHIKEFPNIPRTAESLSTTMIEVIPKLIRNVS